MRDVKYKLDIRLQRLNEWTLNNKKYFTNSENHQPKLNYLKFDCIKILEY